MLKYTVVLLVLVAAVQAAVISRDCRREVAALRSRGLAVPSTDLRDPTKLFYRLLSEFDVTRCQHVLIRVELPELVEE